MDQNLRVPILPPVKLLIRFWCLVNTDLVRDDKGRLGTAGDDHVTQVSIVLLYVALACTDCESLVLSLAYFFPLPRSLSLHLFAGNGSKTDLLKQFPERDQKHPLPRIFIRRPWITGHIQSRNTDATCWSSDLDAIFQHNGRHFLLSILS
jgi:hypothetical protein